MTTLERLKAIRQDMWEQKEELFGGEFIPFIARLDTLIADLEAEEVLAEQDLTAKETEGRSGRYTVRLFFSAPKSLSHSLPVTLPIHVTITRQKEKP